jgi:hypothetical protein
MKKPILLLATITLLLSPTNTLAHERQAFKIGDKNYLFTVGSLNEPVYVDDKTGVELSISLADPQNPTNFESDKITPVEKLNETLKVEISAGSKKQILDLSPIYGKVGSYKAPFYPTVSTTFNYRFFGTIENTPVDITFTCNLSSNTTSESADQKQKLSDQVTRLSKTGSFGCPKSKAEITFPEKTQDLVSINKQSETQPQPNFALILGIIGTISGLTALYKSKK